MLVLGCGAEPAKPEPTVAKVPVPSSAGNASVALGDLSELPPPVRRAFESHPEDFAALPEPGPNDWLSSHEESPQSAGNYWVSGPNRPGTEGRDTLYILPLTELPDVSELRAFAHDYFTLPVVVLPAADLSETTLTRRTHGGREQVLAADLQTYLQSRLPEDAYAMIGLTSEDLYPSDDYNYVFGLASITDRTGVFSLARYDPRFDDPSAAPDPVLQRERGFKILAHEFGHMFGITHCVHHACLMNGANHRDELDRAPLSLCPVCLRKLHLLIGFDPKTRYEALEQQYVAADLDHAAAFARSRNQRIDGG